ncbi:hypothetical protein SDC9_168925 [bioreactor metagenome]|uniref:Uncharacterized protein n=1 Tax=bioreactor metagenome TaxID=1076179 RepID=A0A645G4G5_9ZZZZ
MGDAAAAKVSLRFKIESDSLVNAPFELEFGTPDRKVVMLNFGLRAWGPHVYLYPTALDTWSRNWEATRNLGSYRRGNWHRIELVVPYGEASELKQAFGVLYDETGVPGRVFSVPVTNPMLEKTGIGLVPGDKKQGAMIYLTDFSIRPVAGNELRRFTEAPQRDDSSK